MCIYIYKVEDVTFIITPQRTLYLIVRHTALSLSLLSVSASPKSTASNRVVDRKRMGSSSKDLLNLEDSTSPLGLFLSLFILFLFFNFFFLCWDLKYIIVCPESALRVCKNDRLVFQTKKNPEKPSTGPLPTSQGTLIFLFLSALFIFRYSL